MHYWTDADNLTHVVDLRSRPPSSPLFGYQSLCDDLRIPTEGEQFELEDPSDVEVRCQRCQEHRSRHYSETGDLATWQDHLVDVEYDEEGRIDTAALLCQSQLHRRLEFEPPEFSGDLHEQVENVCEACWGEYEARQWSSRPEGAQIAVEVWPRGGEEKIYYAKSVEALGKYEGRARLRIVSENDLTEEVEREQIGGIELTEGRHVDY